MKALFVLYREVLDILPRRARRFVTWYSTLQAFLAVFDAAALALLAVVIVPLGAGNPVILPVVGELDEIGIFFVIGVICLLMILKAVFSVVLLWWATRRLARYELLIGSRLFASFIAAPWVERLKKNSADLVRFTDGSVSVVIGNFLLPGATILGEIVSIVVVILVLTIAQPYVAAITLLYLGAVGAILYFWIARHSHVAGEVSLTYTLKTARLITEMVGALKEVTLRNKAGEVAGVVDEARVHATRARANIQFLGQVPRFVLESAIVGGFVLVGAAGFLIGGSALALTAVSLFGLAGFRMAPAVVRLQTIVGQMVAYAPHPRRVLDEIHTSESLVAATITRESLPLPDEPKLLQLQNVSFRYSPESDFAVRDVSIDIAFGSTVAFVGASGSGKSTIVDLILGLIEPQDGEISVDGIPLTSLVESWRSRVGYVPQEVALLDSTIANNVALTWADDFDEAQVQRALEKSQLWQTVVARPGGIHGRVGERGLALSGGQRQRLGIARALYAEPVVLVMDEATSALDTHTEAAVSRELRGLKGDTTVILVAHRLATIMDADVIFYMADGRVQAQGTFDELVAKAPDFARQAALAGLA